MFWKQYVLDTSAFLTLIEDEEGADLIQDLLQQARRGEIKLLASFVSFTEVFYITLQENNEEEAQIRLELMKQLAIERVNLRKNSASSRADSKPPIVFHLLMPGLRRPQNFMTRS